MTAQIDKLEEKIEEHDRVLEIVAEQLAETQSNMQQGMSELTSHFMRSIEFKIKLLVKNEVSAIMKKKAGESNA